MVSLCSVGDDLATVYDAFRILEGQHTTCNKQLEIAGGAI